ncbi:MAG: site-specific integrase [Polaromonas sp.]|uniref:gamma-mobile-trio recombinase GmtY n=1 Tax=Polaromonas sp. TaxID=1869339 RepID=UPI0025F36176|nr:gamma-mobile-trio recombinase GmtY [Polaromonas sp.]MBI2728519.1 site-specific integrase [Polaromonas sp.]
MPFSIVTGLLKLDQTGATREIPLLVCQNGPVLSVAEYCLSKKRSLSWMEKVTRACKLFLEYLEANADLNEENWKRFRNFAHSLQSGSIEEATGLDGSGLYWEGKREREVFRTIKLLTDMFDWLSREYETNATQFNPKFNGIEFDKRIDHLAYIHRRSKSFLGYAWQLEHSPSRLTRSRPQGITWRDRPPKFPDERFEELLFKGFVVAGKPDYRGMLITLLMHGGGLRVSEPFHLYVSDVNAATDSNAALVLVHNPQDGTAPSNWRNSSGKQGTREQYLSAVFGLVPRNKIRKDAGWKHNAQDGDGFMQVYWFPEIYGQWFMQIWKRYLPILASAKRNHPYAFINLQGPTVGKPYTIKQYSRALKRAVERIGLVSRKRFGTTEHGFRHAYAQRLKKGHVDDITIQRVMHHCSPESQKVYTVPERKEITAALKAGMNTLSAIAEVPKPLRLESYFED